MLKRTALFNLHQELGGRLVEFGGWEMPLQYSGIVAEHHAVRSAAGIFDISHMGQVRFHGPGALAFLNRVLTNDVRKLSSGLGQYTLLCNEAGGVVDDLYIYQTRADDFTLVINASRVEVDLAWLRGQMVGEADTVMEDLSKSHGAVAVQGPRVNEFIDECFGPAHALESASHPTSLTKNQLAQFGFNDSAVWVARTGYTGEDGFEIMAPVHLLDPLWRKISAVGSPFGLKPAGLGARDTLRTEVCYPLYGHELDEKTTPIEAGLGKFVDMTKGPFVGRDKLEKQKTEGVSRKLVAFRMSDKSAPPRPHYPIWNASEPSRQIGEVTSGTQSPSLNVGVGLGYVETGEAIPNQKIQIEIRGRRFPAEMVPKPIYRKPKT